MQLGSVGKDSGMGSPNMTQMLSVESSHARVWRNVVQYQGKTDLSLQAEIGGVKVRVGGIAKGSGMIHPNMATMLSVITSDVDVEPELWREVVRRGAINSFNQVHLHVLDMPQPGKGPLMPNCTGCKICILGPVFMATVLLLCSRLPLPSTCRNTSVCAKQYDHGSLHNFVVRPILLGPSLLSWDGRCDMF